MRIDGKRNFAKDMWYKTERKKKMKKGITFLLIIAMTGMLISGCGSVSDKADRTDSNSDTKVKSEKSISLFGCNGTNAALKENGDLWMWGQNEYGQIGNGTYGDFVKEPVKVLDDVAYVCVVEDNAAAVKKDGTLWMWGSNKYGLLGSMDLGNYDYEGKFNIQTEPLMIMEDVETVELNQCNSAVIKKDKSLWICGQNYYGLVGNGTSTSFETFTKSMDDVSCFIFGDGSSVAVKTDGSLWIWGANSAGTIGSAVVGEMQKHTSPVKMLDDVVSVYTSGGWGFQTVAALKRDGSLWSWGQNNFGQVGNGGASDGFDAWERPAQVTPVRILDDIAEVYMTPAGLGDNLPYYIAITNDGKLLAWGSEDENGFYKNVPVELMDNVKMAFTAGMLIAAVQDDGALWYWMSNNGYEALKIADNAKDVIISGGIYFVKDGHVWKWGNESKDEKIL